ncbi:hypothetical protein FR943_21910 [Mycobacterium sp. TNTM28]|uniref:Major facilitator superfamily (MFS) profile domain-containing protein n=1 Tax=[Mycobacterium] fortunisiensis TaxID=2600579 RepID=A0ABS6KS71_9MYCO|nr:hypothetical protein [[Mycobacterium] fortunisiensis]
MGMVFVGPLLFIAINIAVGFATVMVTGLVDHLGISSDTVLALGAVLLALIAFGWGALLLRSADPDRRGVGLGLMIGWALTSVVTAGFCTGVNPSMYL